jgi:F0F1-type ATP synthase assembly protein I
MNLGDTRDMRRYMTLSQVGLEMVAPIGAGLALDHYLGWLPWGTVVGAVLGFSVGLVHLIWVVAKDDGDSSPPATKQPESR